MANETVWKIGSRLDGYKSVLSIFRRNNIVFLDKEGAKNHFLRDVKQGDYIAIADGTCVVAIAKACGAPKCLKDFLLKVKDNEFKRIGNFNERQSYSVGVKVKIVDLVDEGKEKETFKYKGPGAFCEIQDNDVREKVKKLYDNQDSRFNIDSDKYTLNKLLNGKTHYVIPVYQRPYSWKEKQIVLLLEDILEGFKADENIFIGTMQLSSKKYISDEECEQDVIDGQQRITTISILLKELSKLYPNNERLKGLKFDWLETRIGDEQSRYMDDYFAGKVADCTDVNHYAANASCISEFVKENISQGDETDEEEVVDADKFIKYLFERLCFVVIETHAGLSKTLQIFNAINATGMDLNAGDLFKIRMYEYMKDCLGRDEEAFKEIKELYGLIDQMNEKAGKQVFSLGNILSVYKTVLIARYDLKNTLFDKGWNECFGELFDTLLRVKDHGQYHSSKGGVKIDLEEIESIARIREEWYYKEKDEDLPTEAYFALKLLRESRYGNYWSFVFPYLYAHNDKADKFESAYRIMIELNKLLFIYSIHYRKVVKYIHYFWRELQSSVFKSEMEIVEMIKAKKRSTENWVKDDLRKRIVDSNRWKNLICKLSEYLRIQDDKDNIRKLLFNTPFDVEHIHALADNSAQWDNDLLNSIGNFAMLERNINRGIGNKVYKEKRVQYKKSKFSTIKYIAENYEDWTEQDAEERRNDEVEKMYQYLFR